MQSLPRLRHHRGADHVQAVERHLTLDRQAIVPPTEAILLNVQHEMLGHLVLVKHTPDTHTDLHCSGQTAAFDPRSNLAQFDFRGIEQRGQRRIATRHQALARIIGMGKLEHIALIEQARLQRILFDQTANLPALEHGDPGKAWMLAQDLDRHLPDPPRSPTHTTSSKPKSLPSRSTWGNSIFASLTLPG